MSDAVVLVVLTATAAAAYVWTKAPLYNPALSIDPWLYTALWTNFDQIYHAFSTTYYVSRIPWILPGHVANAVFDPRTAYFVVHVVFFLSGGLLLYLMCRRYFGRVAAGCAYIGLIGNQMYFNAHRWDYEEGGVLTFLIASVAFATPARRTPRVRALSLALSGFFAAALVTTRIVDSVYLVGLPLVYWAVMVDKECRAQLRTLAIDLTSFAAGALALLVGGGIFARHNGAEFLFFMPQVRVILSTSGEANQIPVHIWFPIQSYFFVPMFAVVFALLVITSGRYPAGLPRRLLIASIAWTGISFVGIALWEFAGSGWIFELGYYFSSFLIPTILCLAGTICGLVGSTKPRTWWQPTAVAILALAVLTPVLWIYRSDSPQRVADGLSQGPYLTTIIALATALLLAVLLRFSRSGAIGALAAAVAFFGSSYGIDASNGTWSDGVSDRRTGSLYDLGAKMIAYLRQHGYRNTLPYTWYDGAASGGAYRGLQSLYYYSYTFVGVSMPTINEDFRFRMRLYQPDQLVLLCSEPTCSGAPAALARGGFQSREIARSRLDSGAEHVWVVIRSIRPA